MLIHDYIKSIPLQRPKFTLMNKSLFLFFCLFSITRFAYCQMENADEKGWGKHDKMLLDIYHNNMVENSNKIKVKFRSFGWGVSLMYDIPFSTSSNFSVAIGGGYANQNYFSNSDVVRTFNPDTTLSGSYSIFLPIDGNLRTVKKNRLATNYIDIPLELRFRSKEDKHGNQVKFTLGAKFGALINIHSKYFENGNKYKSYIFPNANKWRYGTYFRIGYERWTFNGYYSISTLFDNNKGVKANPFSVGITFAIL